MIDLHCHLLFGIDDGSKSIEKSLKALGDLEKIGYTDIVLTPHYISNTRYTSSKKNNIKLLYELKKELDNRGISINLYLGNEIFVNYEILNLLKNKEITTLNDSDYLLIELPMSGEFSGYIEVFEELINHGYKIILAHPERYLAFQKDYSKVVELIDIGVYLQSNLESITGGYGHHAKNDYRVYDKAKRKLSKYLTDDEYNDLVYNNPKKVIDNMVI